MRQQSLSLSDLSEVSEWNVMNLEGVFDSTAAVVLRERLKVEKEHTSVLDLSRATVQDAALESLANILKAADEHLQVRGLGQHQERLLRYLGVPMEAFVKPTAPVAASVF